jgi:GNAT superfamily N-acetyltransferase
MRVVTIVPAHSEEFRDEFARLLLEYEAMLGFDTLPPDFQRELDEFPAEYAPPSGRLLFAVDGDGRVAGCVALRDLGAGVCEMKRMYVRPEYRGTGVGRALGDEILVAARAAGYRRMVLDSLERLAPAVTLYRSLGFTPTTNYHGRAYGDLRDASLVFLGRDL